MLALIVNYNGGDYVMEAARAMAGQRHPTDLLVVDNGSSDGSDVRLRAAGFEVVHASHNGGTAGGFNVALTRRDYAYYFFFNPDAWAAPDAVGDLVALISKRPDLGVLGPVIVDYDRPDIVQEFAPRLDPLLFVVDRYARAATGDLPDRDYVDASYACGAAFLVRAERFREAGGCDADFFMFAEETDLCWRLALLGYGVAVTPRVRVRHVGGLTAPAGFDANGYYTSSRRIYLRERNCMFMGVKNYPLVALVPYLLLNVAALALEATAMRCLGAASVGRAYRDAVRDVWRARSALRAKRRSVQRTRRASHRDALRARVWTYGKLRAFVERGVPRLGAFTPPQPS